MMRPAVSLCLGMTLLLLCGGADRPRADARPNQEPSYGSTVAFSPDGKLFADGYRLWDVATGKVARKLDANGGAVVFSPDGKLIAAAVGRTAFFRMAYEIRIWDARSGKRRRTFGCDGSEYIAFSPDGQLVANQGRLGVKLTSVATGKSVLRIASGYEDTRGVAFSPDGKTMATGGWHGIKLWNWTNGLAQGTIKTDPLFVDCLAYSPDGRLLAAGGTVRNEDFKKESGEVRLIGPDNESRSLATGFMDLHAVAFSPDGKLVAAAGYGSTAGVDVWEVSSGKRVRMLAVPPPATAVWSVAFSPDGRLLVAGGIHVVDHLEANLYASRQAPPKFWSVATGEELPVLSLPPPR